MSKHRPNIIRFGSKKECLKIVLLSRPTKIGFAGYVWSPLLEKPAPFMVKEDKEDNLAGLDVYSNGTRIIAMKKEIFYGFKRGDCTARTVIFHEIGHLICGGYEIYIDAPDQYDEDRTNRLSEGEILDIEKSADDFAVKYLGADYVAKGLHGVMDLIDPSEDDEDFDQEEYMMACEELEKRIKRIMNC